jgi:hypothetical protein
MNLRCWILASCWACGDSMKLRYLSSVLYSSLSLIDIQETKPVSLEDMTPDEIEQEIQDLDEARAMLLRSLERNRAMEAEIDQGITRVSAALFYAEQKELQEIKRAYQ